MKHIFLNPIRAFALLCVAVTTGYIMVMGWYLNATLSGPDWCSRALGAERASPGNTIKGLDACIDLLKIQLSAVSANSHILFGVIALSLAVLIVIVIAGAKLDLAVSKDGITSHVARDDAPAAAQVVADKAQDAADVIKEQAP